MFNRQSSAVLKINTSAASTALSHIDIPNDGQEIRFGAGQDTSLYHDGSDFIIDNSTGFIRIIESVIQQEATNNTELRQKATAASDANFSGITGIRSARTRSGGEEAFSGFFRFAHDGAGDDSKGRFDLLVNDGSAEAVKITMFSTGKGTWGATGATPNATLAIVNVDPASADGQDALDISTTHSGSLVGTGAKINFTSGLNSTQVAGIRTYLDSAARVSLHLTSGVGAQTTRIKIKDSGETIIGNPGTTDLTIESNGDTYWTGAGSGLPFACMYVDGAQSIIVALTSGVIAEVKDDGTTSLNDGWLGGDLNLITFPTGGDEHYLQVTKAGFYRIQWSLSFNTANPGANVEIHGGIAVDGTAIRNKAEAHRTIANNSDTGNMSGTAMIDCPNGTEQISIWILNSTNNANVTVEHGNVSMLMAGGT